MCVLPMWKVGRVHSTIRKVPKVSKNKILQQGVPEECMGLPSSLVCGSIAMIDDMESHHLAVLSAGAPRRLRSHHRQANFYAHCCMISVSATPERVEHDDDVHVTKLQ